MKKILVSCMLTSSIFCTCCTNEDIQPLKKKVVDTQLEDPAPPAPPTPYFKNDE